jgi:hypothetical protein
VVVVLGVALVTLNHLATLPQVEEALKMAVIVGIRHLAVEVAVQLQRVAVLLVVATEGVLQ